MELPSAQKEFVEILHQIKDPATLHGFLSWIKENWFSGDSNLNIGKNFLLLLSRKLLLWCVHCYR